MKPLGNLAPNEANRNREAFQRALGFGVISFNYDVDPCRTGVVCQLHAADVDEADARISEFAGWLSVAGAAFAAVGFLLPWARVVIGANGLSYVDRWGLAGQNHVLVVLGVLTLLVLGLVGNPVPVWVRAGIGGLGLGPLLLGLVWPYLFVGALGSGPGIPIVAVGAVALIVSGVLAIVADRHGTAAPGV